MNINHYVDVSVIIPIYNGSKWIDKCFQSILNQTAVKKLCIEICVCNDASTDNTSEILKTWIPVFETNDIYLKIFTNESDRPNGVGFGKNKAISISRGEYLCFQDIDDSMLPNRILDQFTCASKLSNNYIVGSKFKREPRDSTARYTKWANGLSHDQLSLQIYTANGPTIIMPTWFCHRDVYNVVGSFSESGAGTAEDLIFFYDHLSKGGKIERIDEISLVYFYHPEATTFSINELTVWNLRLEMLQKNVLNNWQRFTIWNAGKQGRRFYKSLQPEFQEKVVCMCDVDVKKIGKKYTPFSNRKEGRPMDIVHYKDAVPPFIICVKMDMTNGVFESNLASLNLREGVDYVLFS